jgi:hypothetical protein
MAVPVKADGDGKTVSDGRVSRITVVSIWAYALAVGFVALGITQMIGLFVHARSTRLGAQCATIIVVALLAGLACDSAVTRIRALAALTNSRGRKARTHHGWAD